MAWARAPLQHRRDADATESDEPDARAPNVYNGHMQLPWVEDGRGAERRELPTLTRRVAAGCYFLNRESCARRGPGPLCRGVAGHHVCACVSMPGVDKRDAGTDIIGRTKGRNEEFRGGVLRGRILCLRLN